VLSANGINAPSGKGVLESAHWWVMGHFAALQTHRFSSLSFMRAKLVSNSIRVHFGLPIFNIRFFNFSYLSFHVKASSELMLSVYAHYVAWSVQAHIYRILLLNCSFIPQNPARGLCVPPRHTRASPKELTSTRTSYSAQFAASHQSVRERIGALIWRVCTHSPCPDD